MNSLARFLLFVALLAGVVSGLYFWRSCSPPPGLTLPPAAESAAANAATSPSPTPGVSPADKPSPLPTATPSAVATPGPDAHAAPVANLPATGLPTLAQLDRDFQQLVQTVRPSVVSITAESSQQIHRFGGGRMGELRLPPNLGSGVIVSPEGHIVTNLHVIRNARAIQVHLYDGLSYSARVIGGDPLTDIAVLQIEAENLRPLPFGDSDKVRPGQIVFAVGNPYGLQETVTQGIISGIGRRSTSEAVNEFFQTDTAINPGNSGGPLLNLYGEIIGINNAILAQNGGWQGISFAIPANTARRAFDDLRQFGRVIRTWFGVAFGRPLTPDLAAQLGLSTTQGVLIQQTVPDSPAARAGIRPGDTITSFNGRRITDGIDLRNRVAESSVGQTVKVEIVRKGQPQTVQVELAAMPGTQ
jgi:serine protease Do